MTPSVIRLVSTGALTTKRLCFNIWVVLFHFDNIFLCIVSTVCPGKTRNEWRVAVLPLRYHRLLFLCWTCNFTKVSKRWGGGGGRGVSGGIENEEWGLEMKRFSWHLFVTCGLKNDNLEEVGGFPPLQWTVIFHCYGEKCQTERQSTTFLSLCRRRDPVWREG